MKSNIPDNKLIYESIFDRRGHSNVKKQPTEDKGRVKQYDLGYNHDAIEELIDKLDDQQIRYTSYTGYGDDLPNAIEVQIDNLTPEELDDIQAAVDWTHEDE